MVAGAIGFGIGFLAAAVFPGTETEGQLAQRVQDAAQPTVDQIKQSGQEAVSALKEPAQQAAQQLKVSATAAAGQVRDVAQDAAGDTKDAADRSQPTSQRADQTVRPEHPPAITRIGKASYANPGAPRRPKPDFLRRRPFAELITATVE